MHACELKDYVCLPLCQVRTSPYILCSSCQTAIIQVKISADKATSHAPLQTGELELSNARVLVTQTHTLSLLVDLTWASKVSEHLDPEIIITMCSAFPLPSASKPSCQVSYVSKLCDPSPKDASKLLFRSCVPFPDCVD